MPLSHTVFAVIATELREEGDRGLGALGHEFAEHPVHGLPECRALRRQLRWEQVPHVGVQGEPPGVEAAEQFVGFRLGIPQGSLQYPKRVTILQAHGRDFRRARYRLWMPLYNTMRPMTTRITATSVACWASIQFFSLVSGSSSRSPATR